MRRAPLPEDMSSPKKNAASSAQPIIIRYDFPASTIVYGSPAFSTLLSPSSLASFFFSFTSDARRSSGPRAPTAFKGRHEGRRSRRPSLVVTQPSHARLQLQDLSEPAEAPCAARRVCRRPGAHQLCRFFFRSHAMCILLVIGIYAFYSGPLSALWWFWCAAVFA